MIPPMIDKLTLFKASIFVAGLYGWILSTTFYKIRYTWDFNRLPLWVKIFRLTVIIGLLTALTWILYNQVYLEVIEALDLIPGYQRVNY